MANGSLRLNQIILIYFSFRVAQGKTDLRAGAHIRSLVGSIVP
jgi:hypothetical protein